nr:RNA-guided endonuclease TnpB family protein [Nitrosococcus halophilus]
MGDESIKVIRSKKIRFYPTTAQKNLFRRWFGVSRRIYNKTVEHLATPGTIADWKAIKQWLIPAQPEYTFEVPRAIRDGAVMDACRAVKAAKVKTKQTGNPHKVRFRSKREPTQTLFIRNDMIRKGTVYPTKLGVLSFSESLPEHPRDSRITWENGRWFMCVPHEITLSPGARTKPYYAVGVDPGVRTFLSFYTDGAVGDLGEGDFGRIARLCAYLDDLMSRLDPKRKENRVNAAKRQRMRKAANRLRWKIKDLIREVHWKCARFLCENFEVVFIPDFETQQMASRTKRKLRKKSVRAMLTWSHYQFRQRLEWMAKKLGTTVISVNESYTSKTVNWTGEVNHKLGGARIVKGSDGNSMKRDHNGALGIYLKGFVGYGLTKC